MPYLLTDAAAAEIRELIQLLGRIDPSLTADRDKRIIVKSTGEINYSGLQYWLRQYSDTRAFNHDVLSQLLKPERRWEENSVEDPEYFWDLIDAVNGLLEHCRQKHDGAMGRKLDELEAKAVQLTKKSIKEVSIKPNPANQSRPDTQQDTPATLYAEPPAIDVSHTPPSSGTLVVREPMPNPQQPLHLNGQQMEELQLVLQKVFYRPKMFAMMLKLQLDENVENLVSDGTHSERIFDVIQAFNADDRAEDLLRGALMAKPNSPDLQELATKWLKI